MSLRILDLPLRVGTLGVLLLTAAWFMLLPAPERVAEGARARMKQALEARFEAEARQRVAVMLDALEAVEEKSVARVRAEMDALLPLVLPDPAGRKAWKRRFDNARETNRRERRLLLERELMEEETASRARALSAAEPEIAAAVEASARSMRRLAVLLLLGVAALMLAALFLFWRRRVVVPLAGLRGTMDSVAEGSDERVPPPGPGPLAEVFLAFNRMVDVLTAARRELRVEVDRQTHALAEGLAEQQTLNARLREVLEELRSTQEKLLRQEKMAALGTLAGGVAHEFNNVLGGIRGCAEDLLDDLEYGASEEAAESLRVITRAAERGRRIVDGLLRFSQSAVRKPRSLRLEPLLGEVARLLRHDAEERGVEIVIDARDDLVVEADPVEMEQVLDNLMRNALQVAPRGSAVRVLMRREEGRARVHVLDRGPGVPADLKERIFEPFFTTREREGGAGLGLAITHGIVQALGGRLEVEDREGGGAAFVLDMCPASAEEEEHGDE